MTVPDLAAVLGGFRSRLPAMSVPPAPDGVSTYRIRVDLDRIRPPVWRRLDVAGDLRLDALHHVLQVAMGWDDEHLHAFRRPGDDPRQRFLTASDQRSARQGELAECSVRVDQVLREAGDVLRYDYDFGDDWSHTIRLEAIRSRELHEPAALALAGRRACPPEDCGGAFRYLLMVLAKAGDHEAIEALGPDGLEWLAPPDFDPDRFDVDDVNARLRAATSSTPCCWAR